MQTQWERFREATVILAGCGPVKQRLLEAYQSHLAGLPTEELPRDLRSSFASLEAALHHSPRLGSLDAVSASVRKMSEHDAGLHAQAIVRIFAGLQEPAVAARPAALLRAVPDDEPLPAFLNRA
jgi:hypothetical protein